MRMMRLTRRRIPRECDLDFIPSLSCPFHFYLPGNPILPRTQYKRKKPNSEELSGDKVKQKITSQAATAYSLSLGQSSIKDKKKDLFTRQIGSKLH